MAVSFVLRYPRNQIQNSLYENNFKAFFADGKVESVDGRKIFFCSATKHTKN